MFHMKVVMASVRFELIETASGSSASGVDHAKRCAQPKNTNQLVQNILKMNGAHISNEAPPAQAEVMLMATVDAIAFAPAKFEDANVRFDECRYREIDLAPHPAFLSSDVHVLDEPSISSLRAMPIDATAHHTLIRDGIRPTHVDWQASFNIRCPATKTR